MSTTLDSIRAFAQLVWLLVYRTDSTDEQKQALRTALREMREGGCVLSLAELNRRIATASELQPVPSELPWLNELASRMAAHSVGLLDFAPAAKAGDVLGVARVLASVPVHGDEGMHFDSRSMVLQLTTVGVRLGRAGFVRRHTPIATTRVGTVPPARTPSLGIATIDAPATAPWSSLPREQGIGAPTPSAGVDRVSTHDAPGAGDAHARMIETAFSRPGLSRGVDEALRRLDADLTAESAPPLLDELSRLAEDFARDGLWVGVADVLQRLTAREESVSDVDVRRAFLIHLRRLMKPGILRGLAQLLIKRRDLREGVESIFIRAGEVGAEVLLDLMVTSNLASERRAYRSCIARCPASLEPLLALLQDERWYVVRNAAELLGEMEARDADARLIGALKHSDARVRRAAAGALSRLGTARGVHALQHLLGDTNATVRLQAVHGLSTARQPRSVPALLQALDREQDPQLQHALLHALGAHPTDAAVQRLSVAAAPGSLLSRKATPYRLAAVHGLGDAATHSALAVLRRLQSDKDRDVRVAVERALAAHAQGMPADR